MVKVAYRGYFDDGATFIDQTRQPIEFPCADGWMPPAFVDAVRDMAVGETKRVRVGADEAYEKRTEERVIEVERAKIPANIKLAVGDLAVVVAFASAHRDAAFRGCRQAIEAVKHQAPIWKQEHFSDGGAAWSDGTPLVVADAATGREDA